MHGDHLVILRRGRLFTVAIGDRQLRPVASIEAYGPDMSPGNAWYDEMLVSGNTLVVIGYSYQRGGTEIGVFEISRSGALAYRATYHLRSNDYYSSRNYASRLIGNEARVLLAAVSESVCRGPIWVVSRDAPLACRGQGGGFQAYRSRHPHLPRRERRSEPRHRAAQRLRLRPREAGDDLREHRSHGATWARLLRIANVRVRVDLPMAPQPRRNAAGIGRVPHSARRFGTECAARRGQPDRPVLVSGGERHAECAGPLQRTRRSDVGRRSRHGRSRPPSRAARTLFRRPRCRPGKRLSPIATAERSRAAEPLRRALPALWRRDGVGVARTYRPTPRSTWCVTPKA